jgi:iron complex outermembrane receptor protein
VYLGAVRINDEVGGAADLSTVPRFLLERVEVYRGHAPARLTQLGLGGAIVLVPRRLETSESSVAVDAGSFGYRAARGQLGWVGEGRQLLAAVEAQGADNDYPFYDTRGTLFVDDDGGVRRFENADSKSGSLWVQAEERRGPVRISLTLHHAGREQGAVKLALVPTESARASFSRSLLALTTVVPWQRGELSLSTRALVGGTTLDDPDRELGLLSSYTSTPGERVEQFFRLDQWLAPGLGLSGTLTVSVERLRRIERTFGTDQLALSAKRMLTRPALSADYEPLERFHVRAVVGMDCVATSQDSLSVCDQATLTGRVNPYYAGEGWELYGSLGRYQRLATLSELYGSGLLVRGNPALKPEVGLSPELGARAQFGPSAGAPSAWFDVSAYARYSDQLVTYLRTAQGYLRPVNRDRSRALGTEFSFGAEPLSDLRLEASLSLIDARDVSEQRATENDVLPFISPVLASARAQYTLRFDSLAVIDSLTLGFRLIHQSSRYADPAGLGVIPGQTYGDLELASEFLRGRSKLQARISNLWNEKRFDIVGFPLPPRSFFVGLEVLL